MKHKHYNVIIKWAADPSLTIQFKTEGGHTLLQIIDGSGRLIKNITEGIFNKGDICWNTNPTPGNFVGWICIMAGSPGQWTTFGPIS